MADPSTQTTLHRDHQRRRGQDNHRKTTTLHCDHHDGHVTANTTTLISRFLFFLFIIFLFYFTNKNCYSSMYMRRQRLTHQLNHVTPGPSRPTSYPPAPPRSHRDDCLSHQLNHTTQLPPRPSTTTATSQPTQPPAQHDDHQRLRRLATSRRRLGSATAASNSQIANGNCKSSIFFFFFGFVFVFILTTYTNSIQIDYLTTS